MTTSKNFPDEQPPSKVRSPDVAEAITFIDHLRETNEQDADTTEWGKLKTLLDENRLSERKFFPKLETVSLVIAT